MGNNLDVKIGLSASDIFFDLFLILMLYVVKLSAELNQHLSIVCPIASFYPSNFSTLLFHGNHTH